MEILTASLGFCLGINRAYAGMNERAAADAPFYVAHQNSAGEYDTLRRIEREDPGLLNAYPSLAKVAVTHDVGTLSAGDRLVIGFHGLANEAKDALTARGVTVLKDLTCPFIAKLDRVVERLAGEGFDIAIVGKKGNHHCRVAQEIAERRERRCFVIEQPNDLDSIPQDTNRRLALVGQVTGNTKIFADVIDRIRSTAMPVKIVKTMCSDSYARQEMAIDVAREADLVLLIDDGGAAALSVFEVCSKHSNLVHRIRSKDEVQAEWFAGVNKVAIVSGILVPAWSIDEVVQHVRQMFPDSHTRIFPGA
jgi:4-hydroxy-3-methylbut-2-en-1-yl diphosphate reductase